MMELEERRLDRQVSRFGKARTKSELDFYVKYDYIALYGVSDNYGINPDF
jgi:hypothetical protein